MKKLSKTQLRKVILKELSNLKKPINEGVADLERHNQLLAKLDEILNILKSIDADRI